MNNKGFHLGRGWLIGIGVSLIVVAVLVLGLSLWEAFGGSARMKTIRLPGFQEVELDAPGLYAGIYQHTGKGAIPAKEISQMSVRIFEKGSYEEVPVLMNTTGQVFQRFGMTGMPVFNFMAPRPGTYDISAVYANGQSGPAISVLLFAQSVQNVKQTLIVGVSFFVFFLALGILLLVNLNRWAPNTKAA